MCAHALRCALASTYALSSICALAYIQYINVCPMLQIHQCAFLHCADQDATCALALVPVCCPEKSCWLFDIATSITLHEIFHLGIKRMTSLQQKKTMGICKVMPMLCITLHCVPLCRASPVYLLPSTATDMSQGSIAASGLPKQIDGVIVGDRRSPVLQKVGMDRRAWQAPAARNRPATPIFTV